MIKKGDKVYSAQLVQIDGQGDLMLVREHLVHHAGKTIRLTPQYAFQTVLHERDIERDFGLTPELAVENLRYRQLKKTLKLQKQAEDAAEDGRRMQLAPLRLLTVEQQEQKKKHMLGVLSSKQEQV